MLWLPVLRCPVCGHAWLRPAEARHEWKRPLAKAAVKSEIRGTLLLLSTVVLYLSGVGASAYFCGNALWSLEPARVTDTSALAAFFVILSVAWCALLCGPFGHLRGSHAGGAMLGGLLCVNREWGYNGAFFFAVVAAFLGGCLVAGWRGWILGIGMGAVVFLSVVGGAADGIMSLWLGWTPSVDQPGWSDRSTPVLVNMAALVGAALLMRSVVLAGLRAPGRRLSRLQRRARRLRPWRKARVN